MRWPLTLVLIPIICIALITLYTDDIVNSLLFHPVKGLSVKLESINLLKKLYYSSPNET